MTGWLLWTVGLVALASLNAWLAYRTGWDGWVWVALGCGFAWGLLAVPK